jgi:hypothetical protein
LTADVLAAYVTELEARRATVKKERAALNRLEAAVLGQDPGRATLAADAQRPRQPARARSGRGS